MTARAKSYHHGQLREAILAAATEMLAKEGPNELSLREVARRAGVSHGAPYHHFATKQDLLTALAVQGFVDLDATMAEAQGIAPATARDQLLAAGIGYVLFALKHRAVFKLMFSREYAPAEGHRRSADPLSQSAYARLVSALQQHRESLGQPVDEIEILLDAASAWATVHGLATLFIDGQLEQVPVERVAFIRAVLQRPLTSQSP